MESLEYEEVSHIIHLRGSIEQRTLYAYVELFNMQTFIVVFSYDYHGPDLNQTYCHDVIKNADLQKNIRLRLLRHHLEGLRYDSNLMGQRLISRFERLLKIIERKQMSR